MANSKDTKATIPFWQKQGFTLAWAGIIVVLMVLTAYLGWQLVQALDAAEMQSTELTTQNEQLQSDLTTSNNDLATLSSENEALSSIINNLQQAPADSGDCTAITTNIGLASYQVPCGWHSTFDLAYLSHPTSIGYSSSTPIVIYNGHELAAAAVKIEITRYSAALGNEDDDPLTGLLAGYASAGIVAYQASNDSGVLLYRVEEVDSQLGQINNYYAQRNYAGDVYLLHIEERSEIDGDGSIVANTFSWSV